MHNICIYVVNLNFIKLQFKFDINNYRNFGSYFHIKISACIYCLSFHTCITPAINIHAFHMGLENEQSFNSFPPNRSNLMHNFAFGN